MGDGVGAASARSSLDMLVPILVVGVVRFFAGSVRGGVVSVAWSGDVVGVGIFVVVVVLEIVVASTKCFCLLRFSLACRISCRRLIFWRWVVFVFVFVCLFVLFFVCSVSLQLLLSLLLSLLRLVKLLFLLVGGAGVAVGVYAGDADDSCRTFCRFSCLHKLLILCRLGIKSALLSLLSCHWDWSLYSLSLLLNTCAMAFLVVVDADSDIDESVVRVVAVDSTVSLASPSWSQHIFTHSR